MIDEHEPLSFVGKTLPHAFRGAETAVAPGGTRAYDEAEWRDALVVVERGEIELECLSGRRHRLRCGAVLWLAGLPLRALHNPGTTPALLVAISRARSDESRPGTRSEARDARIEGDADDHHRYP